MYEDEPIVKFCKFLKEGWVTRMGQHIYIDDDGEEHTGKDAIDTSKKDVDKKGEKDTDGKKDTGNSSKESIAYASKFDKEYREAKIEHCGVIDKDGKQEYLQIGDDSQIRLSDESVEKIRGSKMFIHNHPSGSSFSPEDIKVMKALDVKELVVVGGGYKYTATPIGFTKSKDVISSYVQTKQDLMPKYKNLVAEGKSENEAWKEHSHEIWTKIAKKSGINYKREKL